MNAAEIEEKILAYLKNDLRIDTDTISPDSELVSTGTIDSADLVRFAAFLEQSFDFEIPDQDVSGERFDTVAMSVQYVLENAG